MPRRKSRRRDARRIEAHVEMRQWILRQMGLSEVRVLDFWPGDGAVWHAMEDRVTIRQWTRAEWSLEWLGQIDCYDVIDVAPHADPWAVVNAIASRVRHETALIVTWTRAMPSSVEGLARSLAHLPQSWPVPKTPQLAMCLNDGALARAIAPDVRIGPAGRIEIDGWTVYAAALRTSDTTSAV